MALVWLRRGLAVVVVCLFTLQNGLLSPRTPGADLDSGYFLALTDRVAVGARFGHDVFFTYGPLVSLYAGFHHPALWDWTWPLRALVDLVLATALMLSLSRVPLAIAVICGLFAIAAAGGDGIPMALGVVPALLWARTDASWYRRLWFLAPLLAVIALLQKVTLGSVAFAALLLIDCGRLSERRAPVFVPAFVVILVAVWLVLGQSIPDLLPFLRGSFAVSSNFNEAMQFSGPGWEVVGYLAITAGVLAVAFPARSAFGPRLLVAWSALAALVFFGMKAGFVRHDGPHSITAWSVATLLVLLGLPLVADSRRRAALTLLGLLGLGSQQYWARHHQIAPSVRAPIAQAWTQPVVANLQALGALLRDPQRYRAELDEQRVHAFAAIRSADPLPSVGGTVDIVPSKQASLVASGMNYSPRPTIQGYLAADDYSLARNREFFEGERAPDNLLFGLDVLDGRYPSLSDAASWPAIFARYEKSGADHGIPLLTRRSAPRSAREELIGDANARLGDFLPVPNRRKHAVWAAMDLQPTFLGRILAAVWKAPVVTIHVELADGSSQQFRVIPAIAREGFLLSPLVANGSEAVDLMEGALRPLDLVTVTRFSVTLSSAGFALRQPIAIRFYRVLIE